MGENSKGRYAWFDIFEEVWFAQLELNQNIINVMIQMRYDNPKCFNTSTVISHPYILELNNLQVGN